MHAFGEEPLVLKQMFPHSLYHVWVANMTRIQRIEQIATPLALLLMEGQYDLELIKIHHCRLLMSKYSNNGWRDKHEVLSLHQGSRACLLGFPSKDELHKGSTLIDTK